MKILFIPHVPNKNIINRVYEFAKNSNNYFLNWEISNDSFYDKIISQLKSVFTKISLVDNVLNVPLFYKPESFSIYINTKILNRVIRQYNIDIVVNANALLFDIKNICVPVIYDMVDDHLSLNVDIGLNLKRIAKIEEDVRNSKAIVCVTEEIEKKVKYLNSNTITIENGLYIDKFNQSKSLKKELKLENKIVFGYIGGVDKWTGIEEVCEEYLRIKNNFNAMLVVGDSKSIFFKTLKEKYKDEIIFCGLIPPAEVGNYFKTLDIGLIPFKLNDFTNNAYPIKALEYGLSGANVISTHLKVLKNKNFPFIEFCNIEDFGDIMKKREKGIYNFDFDFSELSWMKQTEKLLTFIEGQK